MKDACILNSYTGVRMSFADFRRKAMPSVMNNQRQSVWLMILIAALGLAGCARGPKDVRFLASGRQYFEKKDYPRAALQFRNAIQANPRNAEAYYQLALTDLARGEGRLPLSV
jgi:tetratricopeptide (TPR) repeat protein